LFVRTCHYPEREATNADAAPGPLVHMGVWGMVAAWPKKLTRVAAPSPRASLGRRTVCGRTEQLSAAGFEAL